MGVGSFEGGQFVPLVPESPREKLLLEGAEKVVWRQMVMGLFTVAGELQLQDPEPMVVPTDMVGTIPISAESPGLDPGFIPEGEEVASPSGAQRAEGGGVEADPEDAG